MHASCSQSCPPLVLVSKYHLWQFGHSLLYSLVAREGKSLSGLAGSPMLAHTVNLPAVGHVGISGSSSVRKPGWLNYARSQQTRKEVRTVGAAVLTSLGVSLNNERSKSILIAIENKTKMQDLHSTSTEAAARMTEKCLYSGPCSDKMTSVRED